MSVEKVKEYLSNFGRDKDVLEMETSTATVELAARALGVEPARIAKTIALKGIDGGHIVVVTAGDARLDNQKYKAKFGIKAKMLSPEETFEVTGYKIGGVCPFGLDANKISINLDSSLKRFETVFPACGSSNYAVEVTLEQLEKYTMSPNWVDVCKALE